MADLREPAADALARAVGGGAGGGPGVGAGSGTSDGVRARAARVVVRYFAAAKAAAGVGEEVVTIDSGCSIEALLDTQGLGAVPVFARSTFLLNGSPATPEHPLHDGDHLDVLPPFAGG